MEKVALDNNEELRVDFSFVSRVNFASSQNGVSIIKRISLENLTKTVMEDISVSVECAPGVIRKKNWVVDRILPGDNISIGDLSTPLDNALLSDLNEAVVGEITLSVHNKNRVIAEQRFQIDLLARDEWGGVGEMPHLLAAYVSPNDAVVASVLKDAGRILEQNGQDGAINGYQSGDPNRVWMLAGAIWSALTGWGLTYAEPPASFELRGQKVRTHSRVRSEGLATCLDSSLLLAACFEAAGLNPVVLFSEGHAWTGVWLVKKDFGSITEPDVTTVRKAVAAREFVMLETTLLRNRPTVSIEVAADAGRDHTTEQKEDAFLLAVDIRRARAAKIRPLPTPGMLDAEENNAEIPASPAELPKPIDFGTLPGDVVEVEPKSAEDRIARWQRKLLDLSLRNRLLNFRETKQTLPFICPDISTLEDRLSDGAKYTFLSLQDENPIGNRDGASREREQIFKDVARDAFSKKQISVPLTSKEMNARLLELYRRAKSDLLEGGSNTLYLAAGFLRWKKSEGDTRTYYAPLLLIPVKLSRRSVQSGYIIEHHEDDVRFNATLLEFLKRDFELQIPELEGELPRDEHGYDLPQILETMRRKVRDVAGFEVVENISLSTFSFAKYLMWKDLVERSESLRKSRLVRHLVDNPSDPFLSDSDPKMPTARDIDRRVQPQNLFTPLPADSSQLAAVLAAQDGHDFVLIGPPGTGKSQTIANIIAQCLAVKKTVLFVAEKSAALDVVYRRLSRCGLGDAVLELHSNKADRRKVLSQLEKSWGRSAKNTDDDWSNNSNDISKTREQLNSYVVALHRKGTQGFSVFQAISTVAKINPEFSLKYADMNAHDEASYIRLMDLAADLGRCYEIIKGRPELPLIQAEEWSFSWSETLLTTASDLKKITSELIIAANDLIRTLGWQESAEISSVQLTKLKNFSDLSCAEENVCWAMEQDLDALSVAASQLSHSLNAYRKTISAISASYPMDRLESIPLEALDTDWRQAQTKFWPFSALSAMRVRKLLQTYADDGTATPASDIKGLIEAKRLRAEITSSKLASSPLFNGVDTDGNHIEKCTVQAKRLKRAFQVFEEVVENAAGWKGIIEKYASGDAGPLSTQVQDFHLLFERWSKMAGDFSKVANTDIFTIELHKLESDLSVIIENKSYIEDWVKWIQKCKQCKAVGLDGLIIALVDNRLSVPARDAFKAAYAQWWLPLAMDASPALCKFVQWSHEDAIKHFRELLSKASALASNQILERIQHNLPAQDAVPRKSELGTLRHQMGLQRPSMPIRSLISEMPTTFTKLAPCVLMSPLSIAQYLPTDHAAFDVVIFDEASQITTWDAIGAIARGKQAIIVGDPKQLPPTNFFGRAASEEEDVPEFVRDLDSILDEVKSSGIPTLQLNWHYRSRDENLIAFSNYYSYQGQLVTFPSPSTSSHAVQLHQVNGVYGRGMGRTNEAEARAIVKMAVGRMNAWLKLPEDQRQTLGVITFNIQQQKLIEDLLDEERRQNSELEWFFDDAREEPVIVKNLENIQGDERDIILFSITFGADQSGKLSMAFGALNNDGGEKRLNVAVSRARCEMHIFASMTADQIDLNRTKSLGVKHLKAFLDFAARGAEALPAQDTGSLGPAENAFEEAIKDALSEKGWDVRTQIGVSGFRIDLGVVHPDHAGKYLAGVECDGATYHSSAAARDRDKVRQAVLQGLGWNILRIWSTDWFKNQGIVISRIDTELRQLLTADRAKQEAADIAEQAAMAQSNIENVSEPATDSIHDLGTSGGVVPENGSDAEFGQVLVEEPVAEERLVADVQIANVKSTEGTLSDELKLQRAFVPDADHFYDAAYSPILCALISNIVRQEGPLPLSLLGHKVSALHGWQRTGRRIAVRVKNALGDNEVHPEDKVPFIWAPGSYADRIAYRKGTNRSIRDISRTEISSLYESMSGRLDGEGDPILALARQAGISRLSSDARAYLEKCLKWCHESIGQK